MEKCGIIRTSTVAFQGLNVTPVEVEVQMISGEPGIHIVGLPDKTIGESRERIRSALMSSGFVVPPKRFVINLSPADLKKEGSHYDLPIVVCILAQLGIIKQIDISKTIVLGEISLNGEVRKVNGVIAASVAAQKRNFKLICPKVNGREALFVPDVESISVASIAEFVDYVKGGKLAEMPDAQVPDDDKPAIIDMAYIHGQPIAKRAIEIAAAGRHNILLCGPPGVGKSLLAAQVPYLLPSMTLEEALDTTMIYSVSGLIGSKKLVRKRPYRAPHHSASLVSLVGGGVKAKPGEISLAHNGVLFLDELPEFPKAVLEALRQPLESRNILVSRANYHFTYPADIQLVAAMNPCPCGYFGIIGRECKRVAVCRDNYQKKISGPIIDRIDIYVDVPFVHINELKDTPQGETTEVIKERIARAWRVQNKRYGGSMVNSNVGDALFQQKLNLTEEGKKLLHKMSEKLFLSVRGFMRVLRVARTIADLDESIRVERRHVAEALSLEKSRIASH